ncbi:MAG: hypothetical protein SA339_05010 [Methanomassiliicoccus sp.]|nr:hypothetical protein [Methanomassiliicoccus sp.]
MENSERSMDVLGEAGAINLISLIDREGEIQTVDIRNVPGGYYRLKKVLDDLKGIGIIEVELIEKPYLTYKYRLTEKGKKVAIKLREIRKIIGDVPKE